VVTGGAVAGRSTPAAAPRLLSLDVFRGATVAGMVLVNNPGSWRYVYPPLQHAEWHGCTPTDLVFPFFLFVVGVSIAFALGRRREAGDSRSALAARALRRAAVIFALGLLLHAIPSFDFSTLRIPGVLQRIAICYLAAALVFLWTGWRGQLVVACAALLAYWAALTLVPVPGFGAGDLGKEGNLAAWIDRTVLGPHIWRVGRVYDPEGILSTVPAIATTLAGVLAGQWMRRAGSAARMMGGLTGAGIVSGALGLAWGLSHPINKSLWTGSYVLFTAGAALIALAVCYWVIEVRGSRWWTPPFAALGVNALGIFFLSTLAGRMLVLIKVMDAGRPRPLQAVLFDAIVGGFPSPTLASLAWAAANVVVWTLLAWPLFRKGLRFSV
jgi:predicted acyltransferase